MLLQVYQRIDEVAETIKLANMKVRALREALQHVANYDIDDKDYYYPNLAKIQALSISIFLIGNLGT